MGMQASAPAELCGALGRAGYHWHCASGPMAKFVVDAGCSLLPVPPFEPQTSRCMIDALSGMY